jgi:hypothetical protein
MTTEPIINDQKLAALAADAQVDIEIVRNLISAYRQRDTNKVLSLLESTVPIVKKEIADVEASISTIKAGYKTTEFWLIVGMIAINCGVVKMTGHSLDSGTNITLSILTAIYTVVRQITKTNQ